MQQLMHPYARPVLLAMLALLLSACARVNDTGLRLVSTKRDAFLIVNGQVLIEDGDLERALVELDKLPAGSQKALAAWRTALGDEHVAVDPPALLWAGTATMATTARVAALLRPASTADRVKASPRASNQTSTALGHPPNPLRQVNCLYTGCAAFQYPPQP